MGRIAGAHGIRGWIRVKPFTQNRDSLSNYPRWFFSDDEKNWTTKEMTESQIHGESLLAKIRGIDDRDSAEAMRGQFIAVPRSEMPPPPDGEFYFADLQGLAVINQDGINLGNVSAVFSAPANAVMAVGEGKSERLIPFADAHILRVDLSAGKIFAHWED